ncbi:MAG: tannase/feruloyl esterase family alpha/beta hydrolase, partial [Clostridia bacterium]|nr:tannase/feruloyl esterase family alpha/beta hydrolase [Clostridia bacterium]
MPSDDDSPQEINPHKRQKNSSITEIKTIENGIFKDKNCTYGDLPKICRVVIESRPSKDSLIISELWLPENWNGIFVGLGNGGMAGTVCYDVLTQYARLGYAAANTDMGTSRGVKSGINNPDVWKDFGWR